MPGSLCGLDHPRRLATNRRGIDGAAPMDKIIKAWDGAAGPTGAATCWRISCGGSSSDSHLH